MLVYALAIFTGAFLLFQVQPLIGKFILPWFGGGPGVWTTCMLFFQLVLLGGYAYAHLICHWFKPRTQAVIHLLLLVASLAVLPITPSDAWKPSGAGNPTVKILALLLANLGLPYFVLAATSPLIQRWFSQMKPGVSPYRLYALSNVGSLLALVTYPSYFETHFTRRDQAMIWGWVLGGYVLCCAIVVLKLWHANGSSAREATPSTTVTRESAELKRTPRASACAPHATDQLLWWLLPGCASVLLLAITNKLCQDTSVIPFLWVLPLALYLLSFIICFDSPRWYARFPFGIALAAALGGICWAIYRGSSWPMPTLVVVYSSALFICCMVCHGELYRLRPDPAHLTAYYLMIAAGGAVGGVFVAVVAPVIFNGYFELHLSALLCAVLFLFVCWRDRHPSEDKQWRWLAWTLPILAMIGLDRLLVFLSGIYDSPAVKTGLLYARIGVAVVWGAVILGAYWSRQGLEKQAGPGRFAFLFWAPWVFAKKAVRSVPWRVLACAWMALGVVALSATLWLQRERPGAGNRILETSRNFYGLLRVFEAEMHDPKRHLFGLLHGRISHGWQFADPVQAKWPTLYFTEQSGVGLAFQALPFENRRIGVIGLGIGTLAAYAKTGDVMRIYEINPEVYRLASSRFTFLTNCPGQVEVVLGDARLSMEKEPPQQYDLLVLDAFNGDGIPAHLLTKESFQLYQRHVKTNGLIAVHISNHYVNLEPVVANAAAHFNYKLAPIYDNGTPEKWWVFPSGWMLLTHNQDLLARPIVHDAIRPLRAKPVHIPLWTDDFVSLFQILN